MTPDIPNDLLQRAEDWSNLHQWERKQLGLALRRLGLTYTEIQAIVPVARGTLSNWSHDVTLSPEQRRAIAARTSPASRRGIPVDTQRRRRHEIQTIRCGAAQFAESRLNDPKFVGGVVLYRGGKEPRRATTST